MEQELLTGISVLLEQAGERTAEFGKETYEDSFMRYLEQNLELWKLMTASCTGEDDDVKKTACETVAKAIASQAESIRSRETKRRKKDAVQMNLNLYMVSYFLPALSEYYRQYVGPEKQVKALTDAVCKEWETYPDSGHIEASDYMIIKQGFKNKLCFVTTAVCTGLHKPPDCRELIMMKRYRDDYLLRQEDGERLIREYYDIAPTIVKRIAKEDDPETVYHFLWDNYISRCIVLLEEEKPEECRDIYTQMMNFLRQKYVITDTRMTA